MRFKIIFYQLAIYVFHLRGTREMSSWHKAAVAYWIPPRIKYVTTEREKTHKVNTEKQIVHFRLDEHKINDVSLLNPRAIVFSRLLLLPYKYCLCWLFHSCIQYYSMHFQPSQSYKYLVYRLFMFIQSTGLHCLGKIARQEPFGKEKENYSKWKVMIHATDSV